MIASVTYVIASIKPLLQFCIKIILTLKQIIMKTMTKTLLLSLILIFSFSCSSDDNGDSNPQTSDDPDIAESDFFIKAKVNGEERLFNVESFMNAGMRTFPVNDLYELYLGASIPGELGEGTIEGINVDFDLDTPITEGVYNQPELLEEGGVGFFHAFVGYFNVNISDETAFVTDINDPVSSLEITELTQNTIKGKFSGVVKSPTNNDVLNITDGEFFLELIIGDE